jgi:hypothetical protein
LPVFRVPDCVDRSQHNQYTLPVKCLLVLTLLVLCPSVVLSHPGKTDKRGGHRCWKGCAQWQLDYGEYHLHDKDFMPIRLEKTGNVTPVSEPSRLRQAAAPATVPAKAADDISREQPEKKPGEILPAGTFEAKRTAPDESIASLIEWDLGIFTLVLLLCAALLSIRKRRRRALR